MIFYVKERKTGKEENLLIKSKILSYIKIKFVWKMDMRNRKQTWISGFILLLALPYLITLFVNGPENVVVNKTTDMETILPILLSTQISSEYQQETLEAQAVIARSNLMRKIQEKKNRGMVIREISKSIKQNTFIWRIPEECYETAVKNTRGQVLTSEGKLKLVPYHEISAGETRSGEEAFHDSEYAYLKAVDSSADKNASGYLQSVYVSKQQLPEKLTIEQRDKSGYVQSLMADDNILEGTAFASGMGIASPDFSIQKIDDRVRFLSKGKGHGLGFSQYGGNELAKEGKTWQEILHIYFPLMEIETEDFDYI